MEGVAEVSEGVCFGRLFVIYGLMIHLVSHCSPYSVPSLETPSSGEYLGHPWRRAR
jgi:hypothetical protein